MPQVRINGRSAIRLADGAICGGKLDIVAEGASTVIVGGLPAVGVGHQSVHPAAVVVGSPNVNLGGPTFTLPSNVRVEGSPSFQNKVLRDLWLLSTTPTGRALLTELARQGKLVTIVEQVPKEFDEEFGQVRTDAGARTYDLGEGKSVIRYDPDLVLWVGHRYESTDGSTDSFTKAPPQTALGHELVHASRIASGEAAPKDPYEAEIVEEREAIDRSPFSENNQRSDLGLPSRDGRDSLQALPKGVMQSQISPDEAKVIDESVPDNLRPGGY